MTNQKTLCDQISRNNYHCATMPQYWGEGAWCGNGLLGSMVYGINGGVRFEIGRTDVVDRSYGELTGQGKFKNNDCPWYRLPIGALELQTLVEQPNSEQADAATDQNGTLENDIWNAEIRGTLGGEAPLQFRVLTHTTYEAIIIEWESNEYSLGFRPDFSAPLSFRYGVVIDQYTLNPPPIFQAAGSRFFCTQHTLTGQNYVTAYEVFSLEPHRFRAILTVQRGETEAAARQNATQVLDDVASRSWDEMIEEHRAWWHNFWDRSHIEIANDESSTRLQSFWYQQTYKFACATRSDRPLYDLLGPWTHQTVWAACWWNLNTQLLYLPLYTANRLDLAQSLVRTLDENIENLCENGAAFGPDVLFLPRASNRDLHGISEERLLFEWCNLPWICHNLWLHYRCSMDDVMARETLFPLLRGATNLYLHLLVEENGELHLPRGDSPEYFSNSEEFATDTNINLFLLRWSCETLLHLNEMFGFDDQLAVRWRDVLERLTPYPVEDGALMIGREVAYTQSHRHFSHMLGIYPLYILNREQPESRELMTRSIEQWLNLDSEFAGYSWTGAGSFYAALGDGDRALHYLERYFATESAMPNTMYLEHSGWGAPCSETPSSVNSVLQEMLLQSWGDTIRVFPAVPSAWKDCSFDNWRAEGAFIVSARRENGRTTWIQIHSEVGGLCRIETDSMYFSGDVPYEIIRNRIVLNLAAGQTVQLR